MIYVLLGSAAVTALLGHCVDTSVILGVVIINALFGALQEGKAEQALLSLRKMMAPQAAVLRDGGEVTVPASLLVPGDVVKVLPGDKVPAGLRLLWVENLRVDEASLTGESVPLEKHHAPLLQDTNLGSRQCMSYASTLVTCGQGKGLVVATGDATERPHQHVAARCRIPRHTPAQANGTDRRHSRGGRADLCFRRALAWLFSG